ncbi:MAG: valyl-tRNA synthetase [Solirubrobacteraceae bacterium]|jgi:valyl-tRNA synthetase|nr:valyl-tRNA synthetase [Solirubrobacteraceae bacterium]
MAATSGFAPDRRLRLVSRETLESRKRFEPSEIEPRIVQRWLESGLFSPEPAGTAADNYSIAVPPPNVTGSLHMGHALNGSVQDVLIRYHRMRGLRTKWIFGTDHAGIATQTKVEQALAAEGTSKEELGRERFIERVWEWRSQHGSTIRDQFQRLGASLDYRDERFTLDEDYAAAVMKVFVDLYEKGLIYRDRYLVNWDPGSRSAISDLEVVQEEVQDVLYHVRYDVEGGGEVTVATVRPETILADTAVAVHPGDERYADLVGRTAVIPLVNRPVPVIADEYVKPEFGSGALKITPGHDPNDFDIGRKHGLAEISVIGEDGRMNEAAGEPYAGLPALEARERVVEALEAEGRIVAREPHHHEVPVSHRSGERIEPLISLQWFMRMDELAAPAIDAVRDGRVRIHPEGQRQVYLDWMDNIRPWCVSRQLWWGHQLPVWYRGEETYVGLEAPEGEGWTRDPDVLDTWFSSALWPFATLGWPRDTPALQAFYPTDVLSTARDILFLWVARMIMMGLEFAGQVPFHDVYVHSVIQAPDGRRMSKSLGTGIDPVDEIERHGADAVRFGLLAMSSSQDVRYSPAKVEQGQQLANKLWNASRFALLGVQEDVDPAPRPETVEDRWILSRVQRTKRMMADCLTEFDFSHAALGLYDFVYGELCDWYLEMVKPRLYDEGADREALSAHLLFVLAETLELAHPVIPFVTEEIWSYLPGAEGLLAGRAVEGLEPAWIDEEAEAQVQRAMDAVRALRGWRDSVGVRPGEAVPARLAAEGYEETLEQVARLARLDLRQDGGDPVASVAVPGGAVEILAGGAFDPAEADRRLDKRRAEVEREIARGEGKLANEGFVGKAPAEVVEAERAKLERLRRELAEL